MSYDNDFLTSIRVTPDENASVSSLMNLHQMATERLKAQHEADTKVYRRENARLEEITIHQRQEITSRDRTISRLYLALGGVAIVMLFRLTGL